MTDDATTLLREMRDQQRLQLQHQVEALALQRQQFDLYQQQLARVERINERAEVIQNRALRASKIVLWVLLPLFGVALLMLLWPWLRYWTS